jgi:hypothetical protein
MRAVLDLDDTLGSLRDVAMPVLNSISGKNVHWSEWDILDVEYLYGIDCFLTVAEEHKLLEAVVPHPEASSFMCKLFDAGIHTTILTARKWHHRGKRITEHWLGLHNIPYNDLVLCEVPECKADYVRDMEDVLFVVDDSLRHCNAINALGMRRPEFMFSYAMPWNKNVDDGVIRIKNLHDVGTYLEGL